MMRALLLLLTMVFAVAASPAREPIEMTRSAWGKTVATWRIASDGSIRYRTIKGSLRPDIDQPLVHHRAPRDPKHYEQIATLLEPVRRWAGRELPCQNPMTDADGGTVSWGGRKLDYYNGCYEAETRTMVARLLKAEKLIAGWTVRKTTPPAHQKRDYRP